MDIYIEITFAECTTCEIYSRKFNEKDSLGLMLTWPAVFIVLGIFFAVSKKKIMNLAIGLLLVFLLLVQTIYVAASDSAVFHRRNAGFRIMIEHIQKIRKSDPNMYIHFTDYTWPARIEVLTGFGMNYDRFSKDGAYNSKAKMRYMTHKTPFTRLRGRYLITDPVYYAQVRANGWELPASFYSKSYPSNFKLVKKVGSARLFYVR